MTAWEFILEFLEAIATMPPLGVLVLAIVGYVYLPKVKWLKSWWDQRVDKPCSPNELRPVLIGIQQSLTHLGTNDLVHLKQDLETLKVNIDSMGLKMDSVNTRFISHDDQAKAILSRTNDIWDKLK